jgi:hypothetical protein
MDTDRIFKPTAVDAVVDAAVDAAAALAAGADVLAAPIRIAVARTAESPVAATSAC